MARLYLCWLSYIVSGLAQVQSFHPPEHNTITYSVNIPQSTAQSGLESIYFQLNAPQIAAEHPSRGPELSIWKLPKQAN